MVMDEAAGAPLDGGVLGFIQEHPILALMIVLGALLVVLLLLRGLFALKAARSKHQEVASLKKDLMIWSVLSSLVHGGRRTDKAKAEMNSRLQIIANVFLDLKHALKATRYLNTRRPWVLLLGEPSCGKTALWEKSEGNFKPVSAETKTKLPLNIALNRDLVVLDVTGRVFFDNWMGGSSAEWSHICELIVKRNHRKPLSGIVLTISAESLLADDAQLTKRKAVLMDGELLRLIDRVRMRLPVYVVVTKLDSVPGFREYFYGLSEEARTQIFGYLPKTGDGFFHDEEFAQFFTDVTRRLEDGALGMMDSKEITDLAYRNQSRMQISGDLYLFSGNFSKLRANLDIYLEELFARRSELLQPKFIFEGVFFTSAEDKGFCLNARFAELQGKSIDDAPVYDTNFKQSSPHFIAALFPRMVLPGASRAVFTREEILRRRVPALTLGALLLAFCAIQWYGIFVKADELTMSLSDDAFYYRSVAERWAQGSVDTARLLTVDYAGNGVQLFEAAMPNDSSMSRLDFFTQAQSRLERNVITPWQFIPAAWLRYGWDRDTSVNGRFFVYNQVQTRMAFLPLVEGIEYNFLSRGDEPFSLLKRDALFNLVDISLFELKTDRQEVGNVIYTQDVMLSFLNYLFPDLSDSSRDTLRSFAPEYDYAAYATNQAVVLSRNYQESCLSGIQSFIAQWEKLANYPEHDYSVMRRVINAASEMHDLYEQILELQAQDFNQLEVSDLKRLMRTYENNLARLQALLPDVRDMHTLTQDKSAGSMTSRLLGAGREKLAAGLGGAAGGRGGKDGRDGKDGKDNPEAGDFMVKLEMAYKSYSAQLKQDFAFFRNFDDLRTRHSYSGDRSRDLHFGGLNFKQLLARERPINTRLSEEQRRLSGSLVSALSSPLMQYANPQDEKAGYNFDIFGQLCAASVLGAAPDGRRQVDLADLLNETRLLESGYKTQLAKLDSIANALKSYAQSSPWVEICHKMLDLKYSLNRIALYDKLLDLYPRESRDLTLLSELTVRISDQDFGLDEAELNFSFDISREVLGRYEVREQYNPKAFMAYLYPVVHMAHAISSEEEKDTLVRKALAGDARLKQLLKVFREYAGSYVNYWGNLAETLHPTANSYTDFYELCARTRAFQVNAELDRLYTLGSHLLTLVDDVILDEGDVQRKKDLLERLAQRSRMLDINFNDECTDVLTNWALLSSDATYANRQVMQMSPKDITAQLTKLDPGNAKDKKDLGMPWWREFTRLGVRLLKRDASVAASTSLEQYQAQLKFFPLVRDGDPKARLVRRSELKQLLLMFRSFGLNTKKETAADPVLQGFALDDKQSLGAEQNNLQSALVFSPDAAAQSAFKVWSGRMESILELLSQEKDAVNYKLQPVDAADHQRLQVAQGLTDQELAIARYRYFSIAVGDGKPSERYSTFVRGKDLPVISQAALNNDEITLNFFKYSDSTAPECQYVLDGAFPSLQLYLNRRGEFNAESKVTYVPLHLVDNSGQESLFYLAVSFSSELPSREDWPSKNNWPDLAKLSKF